LKPPTHIQAPLGRAAEARMWPNSQPFSVAAVVCSFASALCIAWSLGRNACAEENLPPEPDLTSQIYRYEIINATTTDLAISLMLDTATGTMWESLNDKEGAVVGYGKVKWEAPPDVDSKVPARFRFVPSGGKMTPFLLVDTADGRVWMLSGFREGRCLFAPLVVEGLHE